METGIKNRGGGYFILVEEQLATPMNAKEVEMIVQRQTGFATTLLTVNNSTDSLHARPDPRVYTLVLTSLYVKMQARKQQRKSRQ